MAVRLYKSTDIIPVHSVPMLYYGGPGVGKTTLLQTADRPVTLDFDVGAHRTGYRKDVMQFDSWTDCVDAQRTGLLKDYTTYGIDTFGAMLDAMSKTIIDEDPKNAQRGGLSIQGWGILGNRFGLWIRNLIAEGKQVIAVCHEEETKDVAGKRYLRPDLPGKMAYAIVHRSFDIIAHLHYLDGKRFLDFSPTDVAVAKNSCCWKAMPVDDLTKTPTFLMDLLINAKKIIGMTAAASAEVARITDEWIAKLSTQPYPDLGLVNAWLATEMAKMPNPTAKRQVWEYMRKPYAELRGWKYDAANRVFIVDPERPVDQQTGEPEPLPPDENQENEPEEPQDGDAKED